MNMKKKEAIIIVFKIKKNQINKNQVQFNLINKIILKLHHHNRYKDLINIITSIKNKNNNNKVSIKPKDILKIHNNNNRLTNYRIQLLMKKIFTKNADKFRFMKRKLTNLTNKCFQKEEKNQSSEIYQMNLNKK